MQIKRYSPGSSGYAPRRSDEQWEQHRQLLTRMHQQHYTRRQMLAALKNTGFNVTTGQLLAQMKKWDLMVYGVKADTIINDTIACPCDASVLQPVRAVDPDDAHDAGFIGNLHIIVSDMDDSLHSRSDADLHKSEGNVTTLEDTEASQIPPHSTANVSTDEVLDVPTDLGNEDLADFDLEHDLELITNTLTSNAVFLQHQLPTILEPWCEPFPTTCCCRAFFTATDDFAKSPELFHILLEQVPPTSIIYAIAVINLINIEDQTRDEATLRNMLWSCIEQYLRICTRVDVKNNVATRILHSLLQTWNRLYEDRFPLPAITASRTSTLSRTALLNRIVKTKARSLGPVNVRRSKWRAKAGLDIGAITGFIARRPSTWPLINWSGGKFGSTDGWWPVDKPESAGLIETATAFSEHMTKIWATEQQNPKKSRLPSLEDLGACNVPLIFDTLGLMLALELSSYAMDFTPNGSLLNSPHWPKELSKFIDTTVRTLSLNAEYAEKFRKVYWLISAEKIGYSGKSKSIHTGPCTAIEEWQVLERSVYDYDQPRTWIERRLFTNRNSWPQTEDLVTADNMSIRSVSSFNSFKRFQALALQLKIGTPHSRSTRTKSTRSKMSLDSHLSWQLEHMLDIQKDDTALDSSEKADSGPLKTLNEREEDLLEAIVPETIPKDCEGDLPDHTDSGVNV